MVCFSYTSMLKIKYDNIKRFWEMQGLMMQRLRDAKIITDAIMTDEKTEPMTNWMSAHDVGKCGYCPEENMLLSVLF